MSAWLDPVRAALGDASTVVSFFFRDDDAGWRDDRLHRLLDVFEAADAPIDLAAIPCAVSPQLSRRLGARRRAAPELVRVHQHGFAHRNHEPVGRKSEFGPSRPMEAQLADIVRGRGVLLERLDAELEPIFTPPWNRCTYETALAAAEVGLQILSRESRAEPIAVGAVRELPVSIDWVRLTPIEVADRLATAARRGETTGVMLHHAVMDGGDRDRVRELVWLLQTSSAARLAPMSELAAAEVSV